MTNELRVDRVVADTLRIQEVDDGFWIIPGDGTATFQRTRLRLAAEPPLSGYERLVIRLCQRLIELESGE